MLRSSLHWCRLTPVGGALEVSERQAQRAGRGARRERARRQRFIARCCARHVSVSAFSRRWRLTEVACTRSPLSERTDDQDEGVPEARRSRTEPGGGDDCAAGRQYRRCERLTAPSAGGPRLSARRGLLREDGALGLSRAAAEVGTEPAQESPGQRIAFKRCGHFTLTAAQSAGLARALRHPLRVQAETGRKELFGKNRRNVCLLYSLPHSLPRRAG